MPLPLALAGLLGISIGGLVVRALAALGIGFITFEGIDLLITQVENYMTTQMSGLPVSVLQMLQIMKIDTAVRLIASAVTARAVLAGLSSGLLKRFHIA